MTPIQAQDLDLADIAAVNLEGILGSFMLVLGLAFLYDMGKQAFQAFASSRAAALLAKQAPNAEASSRGCHLVSSRQVKHDQAKLPAGTSAANTDAGPDSQPVATLSWPGICLPGLMIPEWQLNVLAAYNDSLRGAVHYLLHMKAFSHLSKEADDVYHAEIRPHHQTIQRLDLLLDARIEMLKVEETILKEYANSQSDGDAGSVHIAACSLSRTRHALFGTFDEKAALLMARMSKYVPVRQQRARLQAVLVADLQALVKKPARLSASGTNLKGASMAAVATPSDIIVPGPSCNSWQARQTAVPTKSHSTGAHEAAVCVLRVSNATIIKDNKAVSSEAAAAEFADNVHAVGALQAEAAQVSISSNLPAPIDLLGDWEPKPHWLTETLPNTAWPDADLPEQVSVLLKHSRTAVRASLLCQLDLALLDVIQAAVRRLQQTAASRLAQVELQVPSSLTNAHAEFRRCHSALTKLSSKSSTIAAEEYKQITNQLMSYSLAKQQLQAVLVSMVPAKQLSKAVQLAYSTRVKALPLPKFQPTWSPDATRL